VFSHVQYHGRNLSPVLKLIKHQLETNILGYYVPYVDDILILFDTRKIMEEIILYEMNLLQENL
jgi:hypothetical protein